MLRVKIERDLECDEFLSKEYIYRFPKKNYSFGLS